MTALLSRSTAPLYGWSPWSMFRAGIAEELFYRGYSIERFQAIGMGKLASVAIPLVIFAAGHYTGGVANVVVAGRMGAILSGFYLWRRDLVACMFAHTLSNSSPT